MSRPALADYILIFKKPGDNEIPVRPDKNGLDNDTWIEWASPIWFGIKETDTLNVRVARNNDDERHICPLQLGTIERCVKLWSNPGETVFSPFAGIGSEGYESLKHGREFIGIELKPEYFKVATQNLANATRQQIDLFTWAEQNNQSEHPLLYCGKCGQEAGYTAWEGPDDLQLCEQCHMDWIDLQTKARESLPDDVDDYLSEQSQQMGAD